MISGRWDADTYHLSCEKNHRDAAPASTVAMDRSIRRHAFDDRPANSAESRYGTPPHAERGRYRGWSYVSVEFG
jgi:hypothetical protein